MADLNSYKECVKKIRQYATAHQVPEAETTAIFKNCLKSLKTKYPDKCRATFKPIRFISIISFILILLLFLIWLCNQRSFNSLVVRSLQTSIYPGLKFLRKLAVPIISQYPSLTELYDESCLLENPYFYISEMDCWPCSVVHSVPDLTGQNISRSFNVGIPYTRSERNTSVCLKDLCEMYWNNCDIFEQDARKVSSNNETYKTIQDIANKRLDLQPSESLNVHIYWRITRMSPGRVIRKLFPKPIEAPEWWGQSTEKFIFIDEPKSPVYSLPNPECSNIVLRSTEGERLIKMVPSQECLQNCKTSTVLLSKGHTLWYNWWYWRPISLPVSNSTTVSISYLTSFC